VSNSNNLQEVVEVLRGAADIVVATHVFPDPDAIGSSFGLAAGLRSLGKDARVYLGTAVPATLIPLVEGVPVTHELPGEEFSVLAVVDTANRARICGEGDALRALAKQVVNIDHHYSNEGWGDVNHIDDSKAASAEILLDLLTALSVDISPEIASMLYAGLSDDTGSFCFSNTKAETLRSASRLVELGAEPAVVSEQLYFSMPLRVLKLRAAAIQTLRLELDGRVAVIVLDQKLLDSVGAHPEDVEGIVDQARSVAGPPVAMLIRELNNDWKVSLRSKQSNLDVSRVAAAFGGGGHRAAAGCRVGGAADEAVQKVLAELKVILDEKS
jgi:phosphoesterase RecJ-like protein